MIGSIAFVSIPLESMPEGPMLVALVGTMFVGLISCFFGYVLFRLELTMTGLFSLMTLPLLTATPMLPQP